jgi:hypothetical protein
MKPETAEDYNTVCILKPSQRKVNTYLTRKDAMIKINFLEASMKKHWSFIGK